MPLAELYGCVEMRENYNAMGQLVSRVGPTASVSQSFYYTPVPPALNAFRRKKPAEADLVWKGTTYGKTRDSYRYSQFQRSYAWKTIPWYRIWTSSKSIIGVPPAVFPPEPYDPMNPLLNKIHGDAANIANMLGEYKQTANMFSQAAGRFRRSVNYARRAVRAAKHGNVSGARGALRSALQSLGSGVAGAARAAFPPNRYGRSSISNAWLQWHFGVDTLLQDVHSLCKELQDEANLVPPFVSHKYVKASQRVLDGVSIPYNGNVHRPQIVTAYAKRRLVAYVEFKNEYLKLASDHGLTNPASLVWELTTLSFVVDWFIGIGEWITALNVPLLINRSICYETKAYWSTRYLEFKPPNFVGETVEQACSLRSVHKSTSRTIRTLSAARPRWKPNASTARVATALALLRQMR